MALPVEHQAAQQIGPAQERRVGRRRAAEHDVIAAAGADVAAVDHELVGAEPRLPRLFVERRRGLDRLPPVVGRMNVDLDHAGIGRHLDHVEARIGGRRIAFDVHRSAGRARASLDRGEQLEIILEPLDRRHEDAEDAVARLDRQRGAHGAIDRDLLDARLAGRRWPRRRMPAALVASLRELFGRRQRRARLASDPAGGCRDSRIRRHPGQRAERQPEAERRIARHQEQLAAAQLPLLAVPAATRCASAFQRWIGRTKPDGVGEPALEGPHHARARLPDRRSSDR